MLYNDTTAQVQSKMVAKGEVEIDVGCGNEFGGKVEEEEGAEGGAPAAGKNDHIAKINDLIDAFQYESTSFTKAEWGAYFKAYVKLIK